MITTRRIQSSDRAPLHIVVLGSTGSIGRQTLDVVRRHPDRLCISALSAHSNAASLTEQAREFGVPAEQVVLASRDGAAAVGGLAALPEVDVVLNALVGAAGLRASYHALASGKRLALANKESLVVGGDLLMPLAGARQADELHPQDIVDGRAGRMMPLVDVNDGRAGEMIPVDSEHSAIFQCLVGESATEVAALWITASGGPFRGYTREQLASVTKEQALAHPTWSMGAKISIDSATLMNKGLECIEAHHLFQASYDDIRVVVHPQSCVHSMVEFVDGSVKAHLGVTDMRIPIQYAFSHPERWDAPTAPLDFAALAHQGQLSFEPADLATFGCLRLALEAGRAGGTAPCVLNAANEVAVAAFLADQCSFLDIERTVAGALEAYDQQPVVSLEQLEEVDAQARATACSLLSASSIHARGYVR
ncbi:MAG: 1-deoxy-D-xylulose-5-phosphate reductoisomerase [Coriobacteriales bacterium]|jgi:1-deoxy-D-xylulose-5-phosphate reductoisomerase|nr:1-deoxy-D-xylulose-5-phosphate reductoisomerase [Coriobacteriales bacterium]